MRKIRFAVGLMLIACLNHYLYAADANGAGEPRVSIQWLGGPSMLVRFNDFQFLTDPMLGRGETAFLMGDPNEMFDLAKGPTIKAFRRLSAFSGVDLEATDLVVLSHSHEDHFDQAAERQLDKSMPMLVPPADQAKLRQKGFTALRELAWGRRVTYQAGAGQVSFTAVQAQHSADAQIDSLLGQGNGYWIEFKQGDWQLTAYWTGDTLPTEAVINDVKRLGRPDILIPHMGRVGPPGPLGQISMGADDLVTMSAELAPGKVLPIHHSTYSLYLEPIGRLIQQSQGKAYGLDLLSEGSTILYQ